MPNHPILSSHTRRQFKGLSTVDLFTTLLPSLVPTDLSEMHCNYQLFFPQVPEFVNKHADTDVDDSGRSCSHYNLDVSLLCYFIWFGLSLVLWSALFFLISLLFSRFLQSRPSSHVDTHGKSFHLLFWFDRMPPQMCQIYMLVCDLSSRNKLHTITVHPSPRTNIDVLSMLRGSSCKRPQVPFAQLNGRLLPSSSCACYVVI